MKVVSTNTGKLTNIVWNGKQEQTGIFKRPANAPIFLGSEQVKGDTIADRRVHGGSHKACYLFSERHYPYWKARYPLLEWHWGMFGENLTVQGMDEGIMRIGDEYRIGEALVQVSQPREPCYKLGLRFGTQHVLKEFIAHGYPGTYARVLKEGHVSPGDALVLERRQENPLTVKQFFELLYRKEKSKTHLQWALDNAFLPEGKREQLLKFT